MGMHSIGDDLALTELVDPDTGMPVPWEDGAIGMAAFTPLTGNAMAGCRQSLGDLQQIYHRRPTGWGHIVLYIK